MPSLAALLLAFSLPVQAPQAASPTPDPHPDQTLWQRVCAASGDASRAPIQAFQLRAEVVTREGVQRNEGTIDLAYLAPDCIRFALPSKQETGSFGSAQEQYWLKDLKEGAPVLVLAGREYKEDRRKVDDMKTLARNYVALSTPARLNLVKLELSPAPPAELGPELSKLFKKLTWLALESPDFALVRRSEPAKPGCVYRVELGLDVNALPAVAVIREREPGGADPLLVQFSRYEDRDGYKIPLVLQVTALDRSQAKPVFGAQPGQEVYVQNATLRPRLTPEDFKPGK